MTFFGYTWGEWLVIAACGLVAGSFIMALSGLVVFVMDMVVG
mgnify:CR=1 FL=1